jgi:DNA replication regulator DPB11
MVPYQTPRSEIPSTDDMAFECEVVTEMWLERCIDARAFVPPESHVASTPFPKFPIPGEISSASFLTALTDQGFPEMRICSTGFGRIDLLHLRKLVELMGATYGDFLTQKASVLICNDPQTASLDKLRHTSEWGVPAVSADWLWISIQSGQKKSFDPYIVRRQTSQSTDSAEKLGPASAKRKQLHKNVDKRRTDSPLNVSAESTRNSKFERQDPSKGDTNKTVPIIGDGFEDDAPKPSVPESRSPSPARIPKEKTTEEPSTKQPTPSADSVPPTGPSALDTALSGLLQQARAAKSRQQPESTTKDDRSNPPRRKRKPLLGRAPSHSSTRVLENPNAVSRASSIDTLNDDGLGSAIESAHPTRDNSQARSNSRAEQSLSSMLSGGKFDFLNERLLAHAEDEDEENQEPQMTQLGYEDPDAAAMRAELLRDAGKLSGKTKKTDGTDVLVGEVRELEDVGWASGRRTRKNPVRVDDE